MKNIQKTFVAIIVCLTITSCGYRKPQKDAHPNIKYFPEYNTSDKSISLKQLSDTNEDVQSIILTQNKMYVFSYVSSEENQFSADSLLITIYNSLTDFKKYYYKIDDDHNLTFYEVKMKDKDIYTNYYKFLYPNYKAVALDSNEINTLAKDSFITPIDEKNDLDYFDAVVTGNKECGGKFSIPLVCQYHLSYYKIKLDGDSVMFKVDSRENQHYDLRSFNSFGKQCIFSDLGLYKNGKIFIFSSKADFKSK